jgi:hypothetical protein
VTAPEVREPQPDYLPRRKAEVKLADGKSRHIQHMVVSSFWHPDGTPMYASGRLYGDFIMETNGIEWLGKKLAAKRIERLAKLEAAQNAALAAQVDALPPV